jgi:hypothetical protein
VGGSAQAMRQAKAKVSRKYRHKNCLQSQASDGAQHLRAAKLFTCFHTT